MASKREKIVELKASKKSKVRDKVKAAKVAKVAKVEKTERIQGATDGNVTVALGTRRHTEIKVADDHPTANLISVVEAAGGRIELVGHGFKFYDRTGRKLGFCETSVKGNAQFVYMNGVDCKTAAKVDAEHEWTRHSKKDPTAVWRFSKFAKADYLALKVVAAEQQFKRGGRPAIAEEAKPAKKVKKAA